MTDTYDVNGVKVTASGGGYYDLAHTSIPEGEKVRGKEAADARAAEIAKAAESTDGSMEKQGDLKPLTPAQQAQETAAVLAGVPGTGAPEGPTLTDTEDKNAALQAQLDSLHEKFDTLMAAAAKVTTVVADQADASEPAVPMTAPRSYSGQMDPKTKSMFKKMGIEVKTIVLEENESIPPTGLFIGHNGRSYMIMPGEEVDVPDFLIGVLDDAIMSAPVVDSSNQKVLGYRNRSKYPYREIHA